jgi:hypothetical protein
MNQWEVWFAKFPYEDDPTTLKDWPVIVLDVEKLEVLSVKVTSHDIRDKDEYDTTIFHWKEAGLDRPSVARVSKTMYLNPDSFHYKLCDLHIDNRNAILQ